MIPFVIDMMNSVHSLSTELPRDFTDGNIPSVYTDGITVGNNLKQSKKKRWRVIFTHGITDGITDGKFRR